MSDASSALAVELATVDPTWRIAVRVWWSWQWRVLIAVIVLSIFLNFWIGMFGGLMGAPPMAMALLRQVAAYIISLAVGLYFFKDVLDREFRDFRVCVVPIKTTPVEPAAGGGGDESPLGMAQAG